MDKIIIQITAGRGPIECCRVVAKLGERMLLQARKMGFEMEVLETKEAGLKGTLLSAMMMASGTNLQSFIIEWRGTVRWIASSPYRKNNKRKNWFAGVEIFEVKEGVQWNPKEVIFETCRASGPGGQHVNKVETAVRGTHIPSGIQVLVMDSRSQWQNKKLCMKRLEAKVLAWQSNLLSGEQKIRWQEHNVLERGNAVKTIEDGL